MADPHRSDRTSPNRNVQDREREARIEELLLKGLDHYFAGEHELAINVWTRVLFLDRGHARARAYIERARGAVAERHREADELFHTGVAALLRGDRAAARELLTSAVARGDGEEDALALLHRLDRLDAATASPAAADAGEGVRPAAPAVVEAAGRDSRVLWLGGGLIAGVLLAAVAAGYLWIVAEPFELGSPRAAAPAAAPEALPVPPPAEMRILRARDLAARGRLHDALEMLSLAAADERYRQAADQLRADIQRRLIAAARGGVLPGAGARSESRAAPSGVAGPPPAAGTPAPAPQ